MVIGFNLDSPDHCFIPAEMIDVYLKRFLDDGKQTLGSLSFVPDGITELFVCKSLELPWKDNLNNVSCVPKGKYECQWTRSNRLSTAVGHNVFAYEVLSVPNRTGIRIHSANYFFQLLGCVALGDAHKDINSDGELDIIHSGATVEKFAMLLNKEPFNLFIT